MRTMSKILGAATVVGAMAAGGSAFTASNTGTSTSIAGYGTIAATGADVSAVHYTVDSSDATKLSGVSVDVADDLTASTMRVQWNDGSVAVCGAGSYDSGTTTTTFVCTDEEAITGATALAITVTNT